MKHMPTETAFKYLNEVRFTALSNWSVGAILSDKVLYKDGFKLEPIGNLIIRNREKEILEDDKAYKQVTIKLYGKGVVQRGDELIFGKDIGTKNQFRISVGQFIMSKIDARNGAFGIVPPELEGAITTQDFLSYNINTEKILPEFFNLITGTKHFAELCQKASSGTTGRQRVDEKAFLGFRIPVPTKDIQDKIIRSFNVKIRKAELAKMEADTLLEIIEKEMCEFTGIKKLDTSESSDRFRILQYKNFNKWSVNYLKRKSSYSLSNAKFPLVSIKELVKSFEGGSTPSKIRKEYWLGGTINWVSPKDMKTLNISNSIDLITSDAVNKNKLTIHPQGTILAVFRSGILQHSFPVSITTIPVTINQDLKAMDLQPHVDKMYFVYFLRVFQKLILEECSKTGVTVESINSHEFLDFKIVLPPQEGQNQIVKRISELITKKVDLESLEQSLYSEAQNEFESAIFNID
ncbi:hypothetical protein FAZ15_17335 [Sphingobacterium olei]|uniref:Type I restriction modification DNA specificity domain-containing protein n=2 Tax=Sphingobacterium olei TaxID=2571155 RepID=A0A4U0NHT6_9SPHI|nr:hypothetical protein FAZ15_17335 [Sphingobacterium olei]